MGGVFGIFGEVHAHTVSINALNNGVATIQRVRGPQGAAEAPPQVPMKKRKAGQSRNRAVFQ